MTLSFIPPLMASIAAKLSGQDILPADKDAARALLAAFADDITRQGVWQYLDKDVFCTRIGQLIEKPYVMNQKKLPCCQSIAPLYLMALCYPTRFVHFAIGLFETGQGTFHDLEIDLDNDLRRRDFVTVAEDNLMNPIDLFLVIAIRNHQNALSDIETLDNVAENFASSTMEAEEPLEASGLFDVNPIKYKVADVLALDQSKPSFLLLIGRLDEVANIDITAADSSLAYMFQSATPHAFVARTDIQETGNRLVLQFWSWGMDDNPVGGTPSAEGWRTKSFRKSSFETMGTHPLEDSGFQIIPTGLDTLG